MRRQVRANFPRLAIFSERDKENIVLLADHADEIEETKISGIPVRHGIRIGNDQDVHLVSDPTAHRAALQDTGGGILNQALDGYPPPTRSMT